MLESSFVTWIKQWWFSTKSPGLVEFRQDVTGYCYSYCKIVSHLRNSGEACSAELEENWRPFLALTTTAESWLVWTGEPSQQLESALSYVFCHILPLTSQDLIGRQLCCEWLESRMCLRCSCVRALFLLSFTITFIDGFNLNWKNALVFQDPEGQIGSYFGFTVVLRHQGSTHW